MDTGSLILHVNAVDLEEDNAEDHITRFDTWNYEMNRPLQKENNKKLSAQ